jgi:pyrroloquinoline quinone biosynthesis protein B
MGRIATEKTGDRGPKSDPSDWRLSKVRIPSQGRPMNHRTAAALLILFSSCVAPEAPVLAARFETIVLGIAQDGGLPHVGCSKPCCVDARRTGRRLYPACVAIHDRETGRLCLIECTPRIEPQLAVLHELTGLRGRGRGRRPVDAVMLTHAHMGHYLGLAQFGKEVASTDHLPVFVSPRFAAFLRGNGPWKLMVENENIVIHEIAPGSEFSPMEGIRVTPIAVPHRDEYSDTMAFQIRGPNRAVLFVPDVDSWSEQPGLLDRLVAGMDVAYLDATFYDGSELPDRIMALVRHPFIRETMAELGDRAKARPGRFRFIHLNHTNPALHDPRIRRRIEAAGFRIAKQGERVGL